MSVFHQSIKVQSEMSPTFHDVTEDAKTALVKSGIKNGILVAYSQHTTCSVMIQEESHDETYRGTKNIMQDLLNALEKIVPTCQAEGQISTPGSRSYSRCHTTTRTGSLES